MPIDFDHRVASLQMRGNKNLKNNFNKVVVVGASRGVGAAVAEHILPRTTELITVSRSPSNLGNWI